MPLTVAEATWLQLQIDSSRMLQLSYYYASSNHSKIDVVFLYYRASICIQFHCVMPPLCLYDFLIIAWYSHREVW